MPTQPTDLEQSLFRTATWFSLFLYPATAFELWKWLVDPTRAYGLGEVYSALGKSEWLREKLQEHEGMYGLRSSTIQQVHGGEHRRTTGSGAIGGLSTQELVALRRERFVDAQRKFRSVKRAARWFQLLPGVRAVGAVNTLAWWSTTSQSDIDLYVITRPGHIWSTRFWLVLPFALSGRRPESGSPPYQGSFDSELTVEEGARGGLSRNLFCFSFFTSHDALQLEPICLPRDIYMSFWVKSIVPIIDRDGWFLKLDRLNRWASKQLPNARARAQHYRHRPAWLPALPIQHRLLEPIFRHIQRTRLPPSLRDLANLDTRVIVRDDMLKFHDADRRAQFRDRYEAAVKHTGCR